MVVGLGVGRLHVPLQLVVVALMASMVVSMAAVARLAPTLPLPSTAAATERLTPAERAHHRSRRPVAAAR